MALAVNDARSAEERKKFNRAAVKQMDSSLLIEQLKGICVWNM